MAFIRCLNNPEGLYVFDHVGGFVSISWRGHDPVCVPRRDFYGLCRKKAKYGCLEVREVVVDRNTDKVLSKREERKYHSNFDKILRRMLPRFGKKPDLRAYVAKCRTLTKEQKEYNKRLANKLDCWLPHRKIGLFQKGKLVLVMWGVTWDYLVMSVTQGKQWDYKKRKRK